MLTDIVISVSALICLASILVLFNHYFPYLIDIVPAHAWNIILWMTCASLCYLGNELGEHYLLTVVPGTLGMVGCCMLTDYLFFSDIEEVDSFIALLLAVIWGAWAIHFGSHFVGFISITALMVSMMFVAGHFPGINYVGFDEPKIVQRAIFAAHLILMIQMILTIYQIDERYWAVFREGMNFMGSFVLYAGILTVSSKPYWRHPITDVLHLPTYLLFQVFAVLAGYLGIWLGSTFGMQMLLGISSGFLYLYIVEKYLELSWEPFGCVFSLIGLGVLIIGLSTFAASHPQYLFVPR